MDAALIEITLESKKIPKNKLGEWDVLGKFPHYFSTPIFITDKKSRQVNNGTLTLLKTPRGYFGVTCWHVIENYLQRKNENFSFQIGSLEVDPERLLIDHDPKLDLATLGLDEDMRKAFISKSCPEMGSQTLREIYQGEVKVGDKITLGGLPGKWVEYPQKAPRFETFSIIEAIVVSSGASQYACSVSDPNSWPVIQSKIFSPRPVKDLLDPGGLSGGPVFIELVSSAGLVYYEFAGIIYEGSFIMESTTLVLKIRPARFIQTNGKIQRDIGTYY